MKERKNIEHLFQEKFENFEITPPEMVWDDIKAKLEEKKDRKRVIPFWWKLSGIAAVFVLGFFIFNGIFNAQQSNQPIITNTDTEKSLEKNEPNNINSVAKSIVVSDENNSSSDDKNAEKVNLNNTNELIKNRNILLKKSNTSNTKTLIAINESTDQNKKQKSSIKNKKNRLFKNPTPAVATISDFDSKEKKSNTFYNYKNNQIVVANNSLESEILNTKKSTSFKSNPSFESSLSSDKSVTEKTSDKTINENSILNIENKNIANFNTNFDKNTVKNNTITSNDSNENKLELSLENSKIDSTKVALVEPNALEELLKEKEKKMEQEPKLNRWQVTSNVAPIYFSSTGQQGSSLDSKFENNSKSFNTDYSYGLGVNYKLTKKLKMRTGVNSLSLNYNTNDLLFYQTTAASKIKNLDTNEKGALIQIESKTQAGVNTPTLSESGFQINKFSSSLNQKLGYIEVPLEMSYAVLNKKFSIEIVGGLSTLFLNQNEVYLESSGVKMDIGEATNLNDVHFSTNVGLGFKYGFLKNLEAKIEPVFKYQINTYTTDTGNFKPYFIGIYSGLSYSF